LHGSHIMKKMAKAAEMGGAVAIRANGVADITAIKHYIDLPVIGIIKKIYKASDVYITPTMTEVNKLVNIGVDMIAIDATHRTRPENEDIASFFKKLKEKYPEQKWMADCSTLDECQKAAELGFDCVGTTLYGYTSYTGNSKIYDDDFRFLKKVIHNVNIPIIAEGNILTPEMASLALQNGAHAVVVGGAITRPQQITERFVTKMTRLNYCSAIVLQIRW